MPADVLQKPASAEDARRKVCKIKSIVRDAVQGGVRSASRAIRHGCYAAEDVIDQAEHKIKQRPFEPIGMLFATGVLVGDVLTWIGSRRR